MKLGWQEASLPPSVTAPATERKNWAIVHSFFEAGFEQADPVGSLILPLSASQKNGPSFPSLFHEGAKHTVNLVRFWSNVPKVLGARSKAIIAIYRGSPRTQASLPEATPTT